MGQSEISVSLKQPIPEGGWWPQVIATNDSFFAVGTLHQIPMASNCWMVADHVDYCKRKCGLVVYHAIQTKLERKNKTESLKGNDSIDPARCHAMFGAKSRLPQFGANSGPCQYEASLWPYPYGASTLAQDHTLMGLAQDHALMEIAQDHTLMELAQDRWTIPSWS